MHNWCRIALCQQWFSIETEFTGYLESLAADGCGRTIPRARLGALASFESFAGVSEAMCLATTQLVTEACNQLELQLSTGVPPPLRRALGFQNRLWPRWRATFVRNALPSSGWWRPESSSRCTGPSEGTICLGSSTSGGEGQSGGSKPFFEGRRRVGRDASPSGCLC